MLSYTELRTTYGDLTNDSSSANLTLGTRLINEYIREVCNERSWDFLERTADISTVASQQFYDLPAQYDKLISVEVTIGSTQYVPEEVSSRKMWDRINQTTSVESDIPQFFFIFNGQIGFYPTPSSSTASAITVTYRISPRDLSIADYGSGTTISAITNGSASVTGSGTTWTTPMAGRYLRVAHSDTAADSGDHVWYKIASVGGATTLTLDKNYEGTTLSGASAAYTIGEMPILPEAYHMLPVYHACKVYFSTKNQDTTRYQMYKEQEERLRLLLRQDHGNKSSNVVVHDEIPSQANVNLFPRSIG